MKQNQVIHIQWNVEELINIHNRKALKRKCNKKKKQNNEIIHIYLMI